MIMLCAVFYCYCFQLKQLSVENRKNFPVNPKTEKGKNEGYHRKTKDPDSRTSELTSIREHYPICSAFYSIIFYCNGCMPLLQYTTDIKLKWLKRKENMNFRFFHPMSIKFLMNDHVSHYVNGPTNYWFNEITHFSEVFSFITPNVITVVHLCVGFTAAKFISSDCLQTRRIGVLLYEVRSWLDGFDGTVFRAQSGDRVYQSKRKTFGHVFDTFCDSISGTLLCIAIWLYLCKCPPMKKQDLLPFTDTVDNKYSTGSESLNAKVSNNRTFWRVFFYGVGIAAVSMAWDLSVYHYSSVLQVKMDDPHRTKLQTKAFHSNSTLFVIWMWRIFGGQAFLQMTLVAEWRNFKKKSGKLKNYFTSHAKKYAK
ncbi:hypothetical protein KUTeg_024673 [Tegillarca granosa]|uniref:Ceramide phosphoethanolamine synthase n=1 Tax=Tegillarca granosa TaxID=220873 RepID=A0ABQ9E2P3_TEGGR|nr:hypothetical protein KUTeg_024673 [Tegillarca granosa]